MLIITGKKVQKQETGIRRAESLFNRNFKKTIWKLLGQTIPVDKLFARLTFLVQSFITWIMVCFEQE